MDNIGVCAICGKEFIKSKSQYQKKYCGTECRIVAHRNDSRRFRELNKSKINQHRRELRRKEKTKSNDSEAKMSAAEIEMLAWKEGLSYGKYVAKYGV